MVPETGEELEWLALLLQKERDLNTAARIGQSLVKQNSVLMEENNKLEMMLGSAREEVSGFLRTKESAPKLAPVLLLCAHLSAGFSLLP